MTKNRRARSARVEQVNELRLELSYLEPIIREALHQFARAQGSNDEVNFQRLGTIYEPIIARKLQLVRQIAEIEGVEPCLVCGSMATEQNLRQTGRDEPLRQFRHCLECQSMVQA